MSGALVEGATLAFLGLCAAGQRPACDGEFDGAVRWRVRGGECDDLFSAMVLVCDFFSSKLRAHRRFYEESPLSNFSHHLGVR